MVRKLIALLAALALPAAAGAATISVAPDKLVYDVGETVTLTVTGDDEGALSYAVLGRLVYGGALVDNGTPTQIQLVGQFGNWLTYPSLPQGDDGVDAFSTVFDQIAAIPGPDTAFNLPGVVATLTLTAVAPGLVDVNWETSGPFSLAFFGLTDAPGTSFTIVPEPASGALLGIGLLALAVRRSKYGSK